MTPEQERLLIATATLVSKMYWSLRKDEDISDDNADQDFHELKDAILSLNELDRQLGDLLSGPAADQLAHVPPEERIRRLNKCFEAKDARIAQLENALREAQVYVDAHEDMTGNVPSRSLSKRINALLGQMSVAERIDQLIRKEGGNE